MKLSKLFVSLSKLAMLMACSIFATSATTAMGQAGGGGGGGGTNFGNPIGGIDIDAKGVLGVRQFDPRVAQQRLLAARATMNKSDLTRPSELRKVSLNRLEAAIDAQLAAGQPITQDMQSLAGLTSLDYVFFYPDTNDIVIAGPSEGVVADPAGRLVGIVTGKPVVLTEDMVTALRAFGPDANPTNVISVSIDPTQEGLQRMQQFLASVRGRLRPNDAARLAKGLKDNLGLQTVTFRGVPDTTNFARVLVEADYRMKLAGIGLERLPMRMKSYVERANPNTVAANAMERWYFQPRYDGVSVSEDGMAMKINERGIELVGANERVAGGRRTASGRVHKTRQVFCQEFTDKYNDIADRVRIYAELRQLMNVSIAAAYIQQEDFYGQAGWAMQVFGDETAYEVQTHTAPEQVETAVNAIWRGNTLMTPLGGGVHVSPRKALQKGTLQVDTTGVNNKVKQSAGPSKLADGQWWWD